MEALDDIDDALCSIRDLEYYIKNTDELDENVFNWYYDELGFKYLKFNTTYTNVSLLVEYEIKKENIKQAMLAAIDTIPNDELYRTKNSSFIATINDCFKKYPFLEDVRI